MIGKRFIHCGMIFIMKITNNLNRWLVGIICLSVVLRIAAALFMGDSVTDLPGTFDQISYQALATSVLNGHGFTFDQIWWPITAAGAPTAHWSFLYTLYLVVTYVFFGSHPLAARLIQSVITGIIQPLLVYKIGSLMFSRFCGLISAGLTAIYAYFIYYDATLMTEPFFICLVLGGIYLILLSPRILAIRKSNSSLLKKIGFSIILGLTLGGAVLLRQLFLILIPFLFLWLLWIGKGTKNIRVYLAGIATASLIIVLMILPFTIYNINRFGRFVLLNTNSGYAFFWANHPIYGTHFVPILTPEMGSYQSLIPKELRNLDEAALDQALLREGIKFVIEDPVRYILLSISRIPAYFMFWPSSDSSMISNISRVASFGILWPFMLFGLFRANTDHKISIAERLSSPVFLITAFLTIYTLIHLLSWALIRYRLPIDALLIVFAGLAFEQIYLRISNLRKIQRTN
jgi:4-amino-4-deoxy-L-arabinose transferase-like glycosyltransferase